MPHPTPSTHPTRPTLMTRRIFPTFAALAPFAGLAVAPAVAVPHGVAAQNLPAGEAAAVQRLNDSPRHGEWVTYSVAGGDPVNAWVVHPERVDEAPVVVVIHEIFGMTDWIRAVADQVAAEGFLAIAPDLLSGKGPDGGGTESLGEDVRRVIRDLDPAEVNARLRGAAEYAMALPSTTQAVGVMGFCWGGSASFAFATAYPQLDAAVVYYGTAPEGDALSRVSAPVLGLYGEADNRVTSTVAATQAAMDGYGKEYMPMIFDGAGHGFLRQQDGRDGANMAATQRAWPSTVAFFRDLLGR